MLVYIVGFSSSSSSSTSLCESDLTGSKWMCRSPYRKRRAGIERIHNWGRERGNLQRYPLILSKGLLTFPDDAGRQLFARRPTSSEFDADDSPRSTHRGKEPFIPPPHSPSSPPLPLFMSRGLWCTHPSISIFIHYCWTRRLARLLHHYSSGARDKSIKFSWSCIDTVRPRPACRQIFTKIHLLRFWFLSSRWWGVLIQHHHRRRRRHCRLFWVPGP